VPGAQAHVNCSWEGGGRVSPTLAARVLGDIAHVVGNISRGPYVGRVAADLGAMSATIRPPTRMPPRGRGYFLGELGPPT
jgi:hypothetical protein